MYLTFAWRYFKAKKSTNAINIISWVTTGVIAFSTMCLILVLSVFNGFENLVKSLYSNFYADVRVIPSVGKTMFLTAKQIDAIKTCNGVKDISLVAQEKALLQNGELKAVVLLKGVDENYAKISGVPGKMQDGNFNTGNSENPLLVLGSGIEDAIGVQADKNLSPLTIFLPTKNHENAADLLSFLSEGNANTSGSFAIQQDFDNQYAITNIDFVKHQMNYAPDEFSAVEISLPGESLTNEVIMSLQKLLGNKFTVQTKYQQNTSLYNSMRLEKWVVYAVLTLILILAAFNIVAALTMLVLEKKKDISVLQSLGADKMLIKKIFLSEGFLLGAVGSVIGILLAIIICLLQQKFKLIKLYGDSFLINYFPVKIIFSDILIVAATSLTITLIAAWLPAKRAALQHFELKI